MGTIILSRGKSFVHMILQIYRSVALMIVMIIGGYFRGFEGLIYAIAIAPAIFYPVNAFYLKRLGINTILYDAVSVALLLLIILPIWHISGWPSQ